MVRIGALMVSNISVSHELSDVWEGGIGSCRLNSTCTTFRSHFELVDAFAQRIRSSPKPPAHTARGWI